MKHLLYVKALPLVLALAILTPRVALAEVPFAPVDDELDTLSQNLVTVVTEMESAMSTFSGNKKVVKGLSKGMDHAQRVKEAVDNGKFPKNVKDASKGVKKWSASVDKAVKASDSDPDMVSRAERWGALILVPLIAIIVIALSVSLNWFDLFKKGTEKKHIKTDAKLFQGLVLMGFSSGFFNPLQFAWGPNTKKGIAKVMAAGILSVVLLAFILQQQAP